MLRMRSQHWRWRKRLSCAPVRPGFVLQLEEHRQRQTVDHLRFVERDKFGLCRTALTACRTFI